MEKQGIKETAFTDYAWEAIYAEDKYDYTAETEASVILETLKKRIRLIPFGDYLKRYIYQKRELTLPFHTVDVKIYQRIIIDSFKATGTPPSFKPITTQINTLATNWLTQQSVKREVVFLLGFGLSMSVADVNNLLRKGLKEQGINAKNPFEVICFYCYKNGYGYNDFKRLWQRYLETPPNQAFRTDITKNKTVDLRNTLLSIKTEDALLNITAALKTNDNEMKYSVTAREAFEKLYDESRQLIADMYNRDSDISRIYQKEDIGPSDLEHVICSSIPIDKNSNMLPGKMSSLNKLFQEKFLSRRQIYNVLFKKTEVSRFDLITLDFFIYSQKTEHYETIQQRYTAFLQSINSILEECYLEPIYPANPYESFILMCILSEDPLVTYADALGLSFNQQNPSPNNPTN